jgi:hypothetical protein
LYYVLDYETFSDAEAKQLPRPALPTGSPLRFNTGAVVAEPPTRVHFVMTREERGELGDYVPTSLPGLLISKRFRQELAAAGVDNIQYIDAVIEDQVSKAVHDNYFVANVVGVIDCIDLSKSKLTMRIAPPDAIRDIEELHVDETRTGGSLLFRLDRWRPLVLVHESVQRKLAQAGLRGVGLAPAEGYST